MKNYVNYDVFLILGAILLVTNISLNCTAETTRQVRRVGIELEFAATGISQRLPQDQVFQSLLDLIKTKIEGGPVTIEEWHRYSPTLELNYGYFLDTKARKWHAVPEIMNPLNPYLYDGYELVTPPLENHIEISLIKHLIDEILASGLFRIGPSSSVHYTVEILDLILRNGMPLNPGQTILPDDDCNQVVNLILFLESNIHFIYYLINPQRYGDWVNKYSLPLLWNHVELLNELARLPAPSRTYSNVRNVFLKYDEAEKTFRNNLARPWKFRSFNYSYIFGLDTPPQGLLEFRIADLTNGEGFVRNGIILEALIETGSKIRFNEFINPIKYPVLIGNMRELSDALRASIDPSKLSDFIKSLDLNDSEVKTEPLRSRIQSHSSCFEYLSH